MAGKTGKKKKKNKEETSGSPAWMQTFGDMMTLLLTFFVLLFSVSEIKKKKIFEVFKSFRSLIKEEVPTTGYTARTVSESLRALEEKAQFYLMVAGKRGRTEEKIEQQFGRYVAVERTEEGLKLTIAGEILFEAGKAGIHEKAVKTISKIAEKLQGYETLVTVLGAASPVPLPPDSPFSDHYDLGYARAKKVRDCLVSAWRRAGASEEAARVEVVSRGKYDPPDEYRNEAKYDRVEIIVTPEKAPKFRHTQKG